MITRAGFEDLAIITSTPVFTEKLYVGRPNIGNRASFQSMMNDILDRRWLTNNGQYVQEFEQRLADYLGVDHCIAMCNATIALELTIRALGMTGEVIVPSFTFIATAHSLQWQEITPVFCDVNPDGHLLDPEKLIRLITPRTSGVIGVHVWGRPCAVDALESIAEQYGLKLMFDAAHAFGCSHKGRMIGSFGSAEVFSFHATKFFNTFEGGAVATNDAELARKIRLMKNFGFAGYDNVVFLGTNGKMSEISAAMGLASFESLDDFIELNRSNYNVYKDALRGIPGVSLISFDESERCNYQYIVLEIDENTSGLYRDDLVGLLHAENVIARRYFSPGCHKMEPYRSFFPNAGLLLPETERLVEKVLVLPTGTTVNADDIRSICSIIRTAVNEAGKVRKFFSQTGAS